MDLKTIDGRKQSSKWNECSHGIHFFVDKKDAIEY